MPALRHLRRSATRGLDWILQYTAKMFASPELSVDAGALPSSQCDVRRRHMDTARTGMLPDAYWMPQRLRTALHCHSCARGKAVQWAGRWLPAFILYSDALRYVGPFHGANARLRGRAPDSSPARELFLDGPSS